MSLTQSPPGPELSLPQTNSSENDLGSYTLSLNLVGWIKSGGTTLEWGDSGDHPQVRSGRKKMVAILHCFVWFFLFRKRNMKFSKIKILGNCSRKICLTCPCPTPHQLLCSFPYSKLTMWGCETIRAVIVEKLELLQNSENLKEEFSQTGYAVFHSQDNEHLFNQEHKGGKGPMNSHSSQHTLFSVHSLKLFCVYLDESLFSADFFRLWTPLLSTRAHSCFHLN